jgi:hypothetical protein
MTVEGGQGLIGAGEASDARKQRAEEECAAGFDEIGHAQALHV